MNKPISSEITELKNKLALMTSRCKEYEKLYSNAGTHIDSLTLALETELEINRKYAEWFTKHETWVAKHNRDTNYQPTELINID